MKRIWWSEGPELPCGMLVCGKGMPGGCPAKQQAPLSASQVNSNTNGGSSGGVGGSGSDSSNKT